MRLLSSPPAPPSRPPAPTAPPRRSTPALAGTTAEDLLLVVAPTNGRFQPLVTAGHVAAGGLLGRLTTGGGRATDVRCPTATVVRGLLTRPGQLVMTGHALAWGVAAANELPA